MLIGGAMYSKIIAKDNLIELTVTLVLIAVAGFAPYLGNQFITGTLVNASLIVATVLTSQRKAIIVGLLPSIISLSTGLLPAVLAPMIPFIMIGNLILIYTFDALKKNYFLAFGSAAVVKYLFLLTSSFLVINLISKSEIAEKAALMMSWPQLVTAILGGLVAGVFLKTIKKI